MSALRFMKSKLAGAVAAASLAMASGPLLAAHVPGLSFLATDFTVTPGAVGEAEGPFVAKYIDFSYTAEVDQVAAAFDETGGGFFGTFRTALGGPPVVGTGLGTSYQMYALFAGTGTAATNLAGGVDGLFTTFLVSIFVDTSMNTLLTTPTVGGTDEAVAVASGGGEDVLVLTGILSVGGFHVFPGLAAGDFDVVFDVTSTPTGFFGGTAFSGSGTQGDFNGVNTSVSGVSAPPSSFTDGIIIGSGNASFQTVPEPGMGALLGIGLVGLASALRRRRM